MIAKAEVKITDHDGTTYTMGAESVATALEVADMYEDCGYTVAIVADPKEWGMTA